MKRRPIAAALLPVAAAAALSFVASGCTALGAAGNGGWSEAQRQDELARARAMTAPAAVPAPEGAQAMAGGVAAAAPAATVPQRPLDLATALELADRHNRTIAAATAGVEAAAGEVAVARSALLPTNSVRGAYNWYSDEQTSSVTLDPALLPPGTAPPVVTVRQQDFATVSAAMRLAIDLSGELRHGLGAAQASYRAEAARAWGTRLQEESAVTAAYFGLLEARRLRDVEAQTIALHERQLSDASSRYEQGVLTRNEVLVVDVALATSRQRLLQLENAIAAQRRALNRVTGLDIGAPTEVVDVTRRPTLPAVDAALAEARAKNPLITAMLEEVQAADERLTAARRSRFPRVAAAGGYDATTADTLRPSDYGSVGVTVDLDLYSFRREGEIAKLAAASRSDRLLLDRSVREVEGLVRDSYDRVRERLAAMDAATVAVGQAEENLRIRQSQFNEGRATSEDLLDAAELATRQRAVLASALYQAHSRRAELQQLMGEPLAALATDQPSATAAATTAPSPGEANR